MFLTQKASIFFAGCYQEATDFSVTIESKSDLEKTICGLVLRRLPRKLIETWIQAVLVCPFIAAHRLARTIAMCAPHRFVPPEISGSAWLVEVIGNVKSFAATEARRWWIFLCQMSW